MLLSPGLQQLLNTPETHNIRVAAFNCEYKQGFAFDSTLKTKTVTRTNFCSSMPEMKPIEVATVPHWDVMARQWEGSANRGHLLRSSLSI
jgi:hypothetical protein